ncbi:site-specific integrase [Streptomyces sp. NBC_01102]|uniref:site-specific integrase n=1 Tax=Streptomyces sp. NBC_01102 TaxID=2903749 RepID=UPI00386BA963|nr:site-specific integrase [Streptomyces sp. NBC_01102]
MTKANDGAATLPSLLSELADREVLHTRSVRHGTDRAALSRVGDRVWSLAEAQPDQHTQSITLHWSTYPSLLEYDFRVFILATLDSPYPPALGRFTGIDQASVSTVSNWFKRLRVFATWLRHRGIDRLYEVNDRDLDLYLDHVRSIQASTGTRRQLFSAVRAVWAYAPYLPPECRMPVAEPWQGRSPGELAEDIQTGRGNKTARIAVDTMIPLLDWALRIVEDIGPDVRDAWREFRQLYTGTHPGQARFAGLPRTERMNLFLRDAHRTGVAVPGDPENPGAIDYKYLACLLGLPVLSNSLGLGPRSIVEASGIPVAGDFFIGSVTGQVDGRPWRDKPITASELPELVWVVTAACFVTVSYLSGMRPGEVSNLRRDCRAEDPDSGELLVLGHRGKGHNRTAAESHRPASRPWAVVRPVHQAIDLLETLHATDLLFPTRLPGSSGRKSRRMGTLTWGSSKTIRELQRLQDWVNSTFTPAEGGVAIPPDPIKHLHASRFRRTLAYFIVRRPRGLIAAALQYGHLKTKVTLNYAATGDDSWLDDVAVERLEMVLEQSEDDWTRLDEDNEHVSGPAAAEYRRRTAGAATFLGRTVRAQASVKRLLEQSDTDIHHGEAMTCVHRAETAECRKEKLLLGLPADDGPDESLCHSTCANLAYTDRDIADHRRRLLVLETEARDPMTPRPRRDRAAAKAAQICAVIELHEASRPEVTHVEGGRVA